MMLYRLWVWSVRSDSGQVGNRTTATSRIRRTAEHTAVDRCACEHPAHLYYLQYLD